MGFRCLRGVHLNDSKADWEAAWTVMRPSARGSSGLEAFRLIMNDVRFDGIPLILETPERERWAEEIALLYGLMEP